MENKNITICKNCQNYSYKSSGLHLCLTKQFDYVTGDFRTRVTEDRCCEKNTQGNCKNFAPIPPKTIYPPITIVYANTEYTASSPAIKDLPPVAPYSCEIVKEFFPEFFSSNEEPFMAINRNSGRNIECTPLWYTCPNCENEYIQGNNNFCPNCGKSIKWLNE